MKITYILVLILSLFFSHTGMAQDSRTFETKVADALNILPANNHQTLTNTIQSLVNLGPGVVDELVRLYEVSEADQRVKMDYAFSGMGKFLSSASESVQTQFAQSFVTHIQENKNSELADVLLEELALFLPDAQVSILQPLLQERVLQMRVLDILEMRPGQESGNIVWSAMNKADNRSRFKIFKILSDPRFGKQDQVLNPGMADSRGELGQLIMDGMASSGDLQYLDFFEEQVINDPDPITIDAIIKYGNALAASDHKTEAVAYFKKILKEENETLRALAIHEFGRMAPDQVGEELKAALTSGVEEVAVAAVHVLPYLAPSQYGALTASIQQAPAVAQADAIRILTRKGWAGSDALVQTGMKSSDSLVSAQAVIGLAEIRGTEAQSEVIAFLKSATAASVIEAAITALQMSTDKNNIGQVVSLLSGSGDKVKAALIPLIADRGNERFFDQILGLASSADGMVQKQAIAALPKLGKSQNINPVLDLLKSVSDDQVPQVQSSLVTMMDASESRGWEPNLLASLEGGQKGRYIPLIGHLSGDKPRELAQTILEGDDDSTSNQLLTTAGEWADESMIDIVLPLMSKESTASNAFKTALGIIDRAEWSDIRKVLYLQKVYDQSRYPHNKAEVVENIGKYRNMFSLLTVGDYLEKNSGSIQNAAAMAIMNIVMPGPQNNDGMTDSLALNFLSQAREVVKGPDSEYFKENISTYIESVPSDAPTGFVSMFDGETLNGWHGFVANPIQLKRMSEAEKAEKLAASNQRMLNHWWVEDGMIHFKGDGQNLVSDRDYKNFVMLVDWRIGDKGDSGIYLRGTPQVQIWDISRVDVGAQVGSGGLYNNQNHPKDPIKVADMAIGDWNHMKIVMVNEKVSVWLNGDLVVDDVVMENYWDRSIPIFPEGPIELQAHGTDIAFRNLYIQEIPSAEDLLTAEEKKEGFVPLFNGFNLDGWTGNKTQYQAKNGVILVDPSASGRSGNLYTEKEYDDFNFRFEFQLTPGANNGLGIRAPLSGDAAYGGVELQILDNTASIYANLQPYQYHGSLYGVAPAKRGHLKPVGEWNSQEVIIKGNRYQVILNGVKILDVDTKNAIKNGAMDGKEHPGLKNTKGHIGFLGHGSELKFRNLRIKEL